MTFIEILSVLVDGCHSNIAVVIAMVDGCHSNVSVVIAMIDGCHSIVEVVDSNDAWLKASKDSLFLR